MCNTHIFCLQCNPAYHTKNILYEVQSSIPQLQLLVKLYDRPKAKECISIYNNVSIHVIKIEIFHSTWKVEKITIRQHVTMVVQFSFIACHWNAYHRLSKEYLQRRQSSLKGTQSVCLPALKSQVRVG